MSLHPQRRAERLARQPARTTYLVVAGLLTLLTGMEIAIYRLVPQRMVLVPVLVILMVAKFALVAMFYMHLRFDHRMFGVVFVMLLFFAGMVVFSLVLLFLYLGMVHRA
jgi:cytochrome c oxidase subunit 4